MSFRCPVVRVFPVGRLAVPCGGLRLRWASGLSVPSGDFRSVVSGSGLIRLCGGPVSVVKVQRRLTVIIVRDLQYFATRDTVLKHGGDTGGESVTSQVSGYTQLMAEQAVDYLRLDDLLSRHHPDNPKDHDIGGIIESIRTFGFVRNAMINETDGLLLFGHGTTTALEMMRADSDPVPERIGVDQADGMWTVPTDRGVNLPPEQAKAYVIADNQHALAGGWDEPQLVDNLIVLAKEDRLAGTGFDGDDIDRLIRLHRPELQEEDHLVDRHKADELQEIWQVEPGQLWEIGKHRLLCGDALNPDVMTALMGDEKVELMVTDPPYGVEYDSEWRAKYSTGQYSVGTITGDDRADWGEVWELWKPDIIYVWHGGLEIVDAAEGLIRAGYKLRSQIIWNKDVMVFGRSHYHWKHETCWYAVRKGKTAKWKGERNQNTVWDYANLSGAGRSDDPDDDFHAAHVSQKPVELYRIPIRNHTRENDVIVDPFVGSGSALVAAESTRRTCYAVEIEPKFCAVTLDRMSSLGLEPKLQQAKADPMKAG